MTNALKWCRLFVLVCVTAISGCGSIQTLPPGSERRLTYEKRYERTYCDSIPRVYSGVCLDVCMAFIGTPATTMTLEESSHTKDVFETYMIDIALSFVVDTLALPYTFYYQLSDGNMSLKRK